MHISIKDFGEDNLEILAQWQMNIHAEQYMYRYYPHSFDGVNIPTPEKCNWL